MSRIIKPAMSLIPPGALWQVGQVMTIGSDAYGARRVRLDGRSMRGELDAALRHLSLFNAGIDRDGQSGLFHTAHAASRMLILTEMLVTGDGVDDR